MDHPHKSFDFLGYTFRARPTRAGDGHLFVGFNPAVSRKAIKAMNAEIRSWQLHRRVQHTLESLAADINPVVQGWIAYYGRFTRAELGSVFAGLERRLARWARQKYKSMRRNRQRSWDFMRTMRQKFSGLFAHWRFWYSGRNDSMTRAV